jgi:hypothetical protein
MIDAAGKDVVTQCSATTLQPREQTGPCVRKKFELHRPSRFGLRNGRAGADLAATDDVADLETDDIASSEFTVDRNIKERTVAKPSMVIKIEADAPYLLRFQRALRSNFAPCIPGLAFVRSGIKFGSAHRSSPMTKSATVKTRTQPPVTDLHPADRKVCWHPFTVTRERSGLAW